MSRTRSTQSFFVSSWKMVGLFLLACICTTRADWDPVNVGGRQYIPVRNLQAFYHLAASNSEDGRQIRLTGPRDVLDLRVDTRECAVNGVRVWLSFPTLRQGGDWLVSRMDVAKTIEPALRPSLIRGLGAVNTVILDPGHGGQDRGAASWYGYEKTFALDIARRVRLRLVEAGYQVILTRNDDTFIPLHDRPEFANRTKDSIFVSIHFNASGGGPGGDSASGIEVFCIAPRGAPSTNDNYLTWSSFREEPGHTLDMASFTLARSIHTAMLGHLHEVDRGLKRARFAVVRTARVPAVLVECGFLTNPDEAKRIATSAHRDAIADAIAGGIDDYKLLAEYRRPPKKLSDFNKPIDSQITLREDHEATVPSDLESGTPVTATNNPINPSPTPAPAVVPMPSPLSGSQFLNKGLRLLFLHEHPPVP